MTGPGWLAALNANSYNPLPPLVPGTTTTGLLSARRDRSNKTGAALNNVADSYSHIADAAQAARPLHS